MPTLDASSPALVNTSISAGSVESATTASFSPPADSWIYVNFGGNCVPGASPTYNLPTNTGTALSWSLVASRTNATGGNAAVWRAYNASAQTGITVTGSISNTGDASISPSAGMKVDVWTGCKVDQTGAASATSTSTSQTNNPAVTTTATGSRVVGLMSDWGAQGTPTSSDTITGRTWNHASQTSGGSAYKASDSGAPGSVSVNLVNGGASPVNSLIVYEILSGGNILPSYNVDRPSLDMISLPSLGGFSMLNVRDW